ncbi:MAG: hypothetical protein A3H29_03180 [Acidobacteria bacterium RIFCSPLOWO2_02_FULL_67_21]|nr:MAG: hypothetical protein A3H29_03180 [Acidobacteria bacterium RIFCSPLOWO2_02_FULL_67_21]
MSEVRALCGFPDFPAQIRRSARPGAQREVALILLPTWAPLTTAVSRVSTINRPPVRFCVARP